MSIDTPTQTLSFTNKTMIGNPYNPPNPTVHNSPWHAYKDPTAQIFPSNASPTSPTTHTLYLNALLTALSRHLPSNEPEPKPAPAVTDSVQPNGVEESDEFRMYEFKVRGCTRARAHDWTDCPFAHPGEKARRRDPRRRSYSGTACADFRKGICRRGDACEWAHGVFECWLHPTRYRTQVCKDGSNCTRRVCFFAHSPGQLRVGSGSPDLFEEVCVGMRDLQLRDPTRFGVGEIGDLDEAGSGPDIGWVSELVK